MRKASAKSIKDDLRAEYDLTKLKGGVRGKYYQRAQGGGESGASRAGAGEGIS